MVAGSRRAYRWFQTYGPSTRVGFRRWLNPPYLVHHALRLRLQGVPPESGIEVAHAVRLRKKNADGNESTGV